MGQLLGPRVGVKSLYFTGSVTEAGKWDSLVVLMCVHILRYFTFLEVELHRSFLGLGWTSNKAGVIGCYFWGQVLRALRVPSYALSLRSFTPGEASCHVGKTTDQPERALRPLTSSCIGSEASCQQTHEWVVWSHPGEPRPNSWHTETKIRNACCCKPLILG